MKELSIYIHIPFCAAKCAYCDFLSFPGIETAAREKYAETLIEEIKAAAGEFSEHTVKTVFFGGGTPTLLPTKVISKIINTVASNYRLDKNAEISVEANPETVDYPSLSSLRELGVNRLSIGVQSFDNRLLERVGRIHNAERAVIACYDARRAGFENINLDIMFGLPGQTLSQFEKTLDIAIREAPVHISCYSLIVEENSRLGAEKDLNLPDEEAEREMYGLAKQKLKANGYEHYEISNFAKPGCRCRHNVTYWTGGEYAGFGVGAHSLVDGRRFHNTYGLKKYMENPGEKEDLEILSERDKISEFIFLGLRMLEGINCKVFSQKFDKTIFELFPSELDGLIGQELLVREGDVIRLSERGIDVSNYIFAKFL